MLSARSPNGVVARFDYSPLGLPTAVHLGRGGEEAPLARISLDFDGRDALTESADSALGRSRYAYDPDGRLTEVSGATPEQFQYDAAGNLVGHGRHEWEYDSANRMVSTTDARFRYDGDGNLVEDDGPDGRRRFTYDALGLLARADLPAGAVAEYAYDPLGRRTQKRVTSGRGAAVETRWLWAGDVLLSETVTDGDGEAQERRDFLFAPGSFAPLAQRVGGAVFCCHTDPRGAPTRLTDSRGRVAWAASYSAYGEARVRSGSLRQPLRLPGQYHDEETGLHQNRWRMYDPRRGRYLSPDPLGLLGGVNLYAYAQNDPVGQSDPLGLFPGMEDLASRLLGAKLGAHAAQAYGQVQGLLGPHLSGGTPPFLPAGPSASLGGLLGHLPGLGKLPGLGGGAGYGGLNVPGFSLQGQGLQSHGSALGAAGLGIPELPAPALPGLPGVGIPGLGGSLGGGLFPGAPKAAHHTAPVHHAPPPARGAHFCPKALAAQRAARAKAHKAQGFPAYTCRKPALDCFTCHTPAPPPVAPKVPGGPGAAPHTARRFFLHNLPRSVVGLGRGILGIPKMLWDTGGDIGTTLADAGFAAYHRAHGEPDLADAEDEEGEAARLRTREKILSLVPFGGSQGGIARYAEAVGDWATSLALPPDQAAAMRQEGGAALQQANHYIEEMAYEDPAGFAANLVPLGAVARGAALGRLGRLATEAEAATAAGDTAKAARLGEQAARYRKAIFLGRGGRAGAAARQAQAAATKKLGAAAQATLARAQAAAAKRAAVREQARWNASVVNMRARWSHQGRGRPGGPGQLAPAAAGGGDVGKSTRALGKPAAPADKPTVMRMASQGPGHTPPAGRVAAPGGRMADYNSYDTDAKVPAHYRTDPKKFADLSKDPAHGNHIDSRGRQEAMAGLEAEHQRLIPGPLTRGPNEVEFYDAAGNPWDVKGPPSPKFVISKAGDSIELLRGSQNGALWCKLLP